MKENGDLLWKRTFSEIYFLGKRGFYWNPETGQISLDPGKKVPQSMQLPTVELSGLFGTNGLIQQVFLE